MSDVESLRFFVSQRLSAAAEEIFGLFVRTISEYEEQLCRSREENRRKQKILEALLNPQLRLHRADVRQLSVSNEVCPPEQQKRSSSLDQEHAEPPHIKEEQEELCISPDGQGEVCTTEFPFTSDPVKREEYEERPESSQLHQVQPEQMETEDDGEDCGEFKAAGTSDPESPLNPETQDKNEGTHDFKTDVSEDWRETAGHQLGLNLFRNFDKKTSDMDKKSHSCSECGAKCKNKWNLTIHMKTHIVSCPYCGKRYRSESLLTAHMFVHTGEKPFSCSLCTRRFNRRSALSSHMLRHTGEKPFSCPECHERFFQKSTLNNHMLRHTGEKSMSCPECDKRFRHKYSLKLHMCAHRGQKPFSCRVCDQAFSWSSQLQKHKCTGGRGLESKVKNEVDTVT